MAYVYLSIGSNIDRYRNISASLDILQQHFGELLISPVYESVAIGFDGENFLNLVVGFECDLKFAELAALLRQFEYAYGRPQNAPKFGSRTLDIDILTYDDLVGDIAGVRLPRGEITENAFVLLPLADIAGDEFHPVEGKTYRQLWDAYDHQSQQLWQVEFQWPKT